MIPASYLQRADDGAESETRSAFPSKIEHSGGERSG